MKKLSSVEEFINFCQRIKSDREAQSDKPTLVISADTGAQASGINDIIRIAKKYILDNSLQHRVSLRITGCHGFCEMNPYLVVMPGGHFYPR
ncbi:MAG: (2Fe-2S) ferredoxin domain-containing protein, partial [candidate division Zixibacteria bacterium]|nr:(2Fe-2S) ferredoxin domain-containing protein [candidate division Zixibacteria bacterium]